MLEASYLISAHGVHVCSCRRGCFVPVQRLSSHVRMQTVVPWGHSQCMFLFTWAGGAAACSWKDFKCMLVPACDTRTSSTRLARLLLVAFQPCVLGTVLWQWPPSGHCRHVHLWHTQFCNQVPSAWRVPNGRAQERMTQPQGCCVPLHLQVDMSLDRCNPRYIWRRAIQQAGGDGGLLGLFAATVHGGMPDPCQVKWHCGTV